MSGPENTNNPKAQTTQPAPDCRGDCPRADRHGESRRRGARSVMDPSRPGDIGSAIGMRVNAHELQNTAATYQGPGSNANVLIGQAPAGQAPAAAARPLSQTSQRWYVDAQGNMVEKRYAPSPSAGQPVAPGAAVQGGSPNGQIPPQMTALNQVRNTEQVTRAGNRMIRDGAYTNDYVDRREVLRDRRHWDNGDHKLDDGFKQLNRIPRTWRNFKRGFGH